MPSERKSGRGQRELRVRVRTARGRKLSSTRWLERQLNDPYVRRAKQEGMRGRAAYKLTEIDDKFQILRAGATIVDLGCVPGGWSQVAVERVNALSQNPSKPQGRVYGIDRSDFEPLRGVEFRKMDFMSEDAVEEFQEALGGTVDAVISDMAASSTGHPKTDHLRIVALCEAATLFAVEVLKPGGVFVSKVLMGGAQGELQQMLKANFEKVSNFKPGASRSDSSEQYVVARRFRKRAS